MVERSHHSFFHFDLLKNCIVCLKKTENELFSQILKLYRGKNVYKQKSRNLGQYFKMLIIMFELYRYLLHNSVQTGQESFPPT